jgi:dynein heavy chain 2
MFIRVLCTLRTQISRSKYATLFLQWTKKIKGLERDVVVDYLKKELKTHREVYPSLVRCTGELFQKEHWKKMFQLLKLPRNVSLKNLSLRDLLAPDVRARILNSEKEIAWLQSRAQGEVTIREAVQELLQWAEMTGE